ncbi:uncharacterized protein LAJ45_09194 [Morchella importuna]|uniref:uncharacterized protein n=1 Tax=Morchella importuna TaxID=1174673 RepID=UPI001E8EE0CE|nr:uncharacterized protein LAJ45_09194 [Morchella importuna]KAH8146820.1 hypothetical protein LAJ45_09194 [Morchella importuna]
MSERENCEEEEDRNTPISTSPMVWDWNTTSGPPCAWETGKSAEKYHLTIAWLDTLYRSGTSLGATELEAPQHIAELEASAAASPSSASGPAHEAQTFEIIGSGTAAPAAPVSGWDEPPPAARALPEEVDALMWAGVKTGSMGSTGTGTGRGRGQWQWQGRGGGGGGYKGRKNGGGNAAWYRGGGGGGGGGYRGRGWRGGGGGGGGGGRGGGGGGGGSGRYGGQGQNHGQWQAQAQGQGNSYQHHHQHDNAPPAAPPSPQQQQRKPRPAHAEQDPEPTWGDPNTKRGSPKNMHYRW